MFYHLDGKIDTLPKCNEKAEDEDEYYAENDGER